MRSNFYKQTTYLLVVLIQLAKLYQFYEPLNLKAPTDYEVPTETFMLCDLNQEHLRNYCLNKGICYTLMDKPKSKNRVIKDSDIFCSCTVDYSGTRCEIKLENKPQISNKYEILNQSNKTQSQNYNLNIISFSETTKKMLSSKSATKSVIKECSPAYKCLNGGTCTIDPIAGPKCLCKPEYTGLNCARTKKCPQTNDCKLKCDFGFKRDKDNCEICTCNCVNEDNYFEEMKIAFTISNDKKNLNASGFCRKPCKLGYARDDNNCFKCLCLEDTLSKFDLIKTFSLSQNPDAVQNNQNTDSSCQCKKNEVCKYFDKNIYKCPENQLDCKKYENVKKFPVCISKSFNEPCIDTLIVGNCDKYVERFYFDIIDKKCKKFYFSGCSGNRNNFLNYEECSAICLKDGYNASHIMLKNLTLKKNDQNLLNNIRITTNKIIEKISTKDTSFKTISIPNVSVAPYDYNLNKTRDSSVEIDDSVSCQWVCNLNCPFGYKLNYRTKCYKCECIDLNMTECGVPCFIEGTKTCLHSLRANSRPKCVCNPDYDGVYCQIFKQNFNFSARIEKSVKLTNTVANEIKTNLSKKLSKLLDIATNQIVVYDLKNNLKDNSLMIRFGIHAPEFSTSAYFYDLIDIVQNLLHRKNLTLTIMNQEFVMNANCEKSEELFLMDVNENYLFKSNKLKNMISDLKVDLINSYKFQPESINLVKIKIEPTVQLEVLIKNNLNDPEFCKKAYYLQNDIRSRSFLSSKFDTKYLIVQNTNASDEKRFFDENYLDSLTQENIFLSRNPDINTINHIPAPVFLNNSITFITVIISSILILLFLVSLIIITQLRRTQSKKITMNETGSEISLDDCEKKQSSSNHGYFMPNYNTLTQNRSAKSPIRSSIQNLNLINY